MSFELMKKEMFEITERYIRLFCNSLKNIWNETVVNYGRANSNLSIEEFGEWYDAQINLINLRYPKMYNYLSEALDLAFDFLLEGENIIQLNIDATGVEILVREMNDDCDFDDILYDQEFGIVTGNLLECIEIKNKNITKEHWLYVILFALNYPLPAELAI